MNIKLLHKKLSDNTESAWDALANEAMILDYRKRRRHELFILTCYINLDLVEKYVDFLSETIRITDVNVLFNFAEIYKNGIIDTHCKLKEIEKNLMSRKINFKYNLLKNGNYLSHAKGYALIQKSKEEITDGITLITSANFTTLGFKGVNLEIGYISRKRNDIKSFLKNYNFLTEKIGVDIEAKILNDDKYLLQFAILSLGVFIHKWSGNLKQKIAIKYELTSKAKEQRSIPQALLNVGVELGDTFTINILNVDELIAKEVSADFIKQNTIETHWGRWCPKVDWNMRVSSSKKFELFIKGFQNITEKHVLDEIKVKYLKIQENLEREGYIKPVREEHLDVWINKINNLRENTKLLSRYYNGYEVQDFPFLYEQKKEVKYLYESLKESIENAVKENKARKKIRLAIENNDPSIINEIN